MARSDVVKKVKTEESGTKQKTGGGGLSVITLIDDARDRETLVRNFLMDRFLSLPSWEIVSDLFPLRDHSVSTYIEPPGGLVDVGLGHDDTIEVHVVALLDPQGVQSRSEGENSLGSDCNNTF